LLDEADLCFGRGRKPIGHSVEPRAGRARSKIASERRDPAQRLDQIRACGVARGDDRQAHDVERHEFIARLAAPERAMHPDLLAADETIQNDLHLHEAGHRVLL
jgi:hypothetical protein